MSENLRTMDDTLFLAVRSEIFVNLAAYDQITVERSKFHGIVCLRFIDPTTEAPRTSETGFEAQSFLCLLCY